MPVSEQHPEYINAKKRYELVRAIINNDAKHLIRKPDVNDEIRNCQYREDAILTNFTNLTCEAFVGLVFSKKLKLSIPPELSYLLEDTTGTGINIWQFSQSSVSELLQTGRYGLLLDFDNNAQKAFIKPYAAENIINWKTASVNGVVQPWLIVLREDVTLDNEDMFCQETAVQYRVLILANDGTYYQLIYNDKEELVSSNQILDANGQSLSYIPFVFIGSKNNDWVVDNQPLYDMARINLGHYQDSADYQESIFICGQPYVHVDIGEGNADDFKQANPGGIAYGSRKGLITQKGRVDLIQANPNQLVAQAMKEKLEQAKAIGARMIEPAGGRETAEAARIRFSSQVSALSIISDNASWAIEQAIKILCAFMNANDASVRFKLNDQFYDDTADGNIMTAYTNWFDRGIVSADELREYGRKTGIIEEDKTDDEIEANVDLTTDPLNGVIDAQPTPKTSTNANETGSNTSKDN